MPILFFTPKNSKFLHDDINNDDDPNPIEHNNISYTHLALILRCQDRIASPKLLAAENERRTILSSSIDIMLLL